METKIKHRSGLKPLPAAHPVWTPELAYVCGLMASDGYLSSDGRHINLTSKDLEQLYLVKKILNLKVKISYKKRGHDTRTYPQLQFGDVALYRWFESIGITPRKSLTIRKVLIPDQYFFDFLRGEFDGDGCSYAYWDTRWRSSVSIYISFISGSRIYLEWMQNQIKNLANISGVVSPGTKAFSLKYAKAEAKVLYSKMYYQEKLPFLMRKKDKLDRQWFADATSREGVSPKFKSRGHVTCIS